MKTNRKTVFSVLVLVVLIMLTLISCEGPVGQQGPQGPEHPRCNHAWGLWETLREPTCTDHRVQIRFCLNDETHFETQIATGHNNNPLGHILENGEITIQPTETVDGQFSVNCTRAGCTTPIMVLPFPAWNRFYGSWGNWQNTIFTISATEILATLPNGDFERLSIEAFAPIINENANTLHPVGYRLSVESIEIESNGTVFGAVDVVYFFLHLNGDSISYHTSSPASSDNVFNKVNP